jgi:Protein of unknown function (DUF3147)
MLSRRSLSVFVKSVRDERYYYPISSGRCRRVCVRDSRGSAEAQKFRRSVWRRSGGCACHLNSNRCRSGRCLWGNRVPFNDSWGNRFFPLRFVCELASDAVSAKSASGGPRYDASLVRCIVWTLASLVTMNFMRIQIDLSTLKKTKWHEYAGRFLFGGLVTAIAGIIAKHYGPVIGGLFLACPAIFPASATLIEKHEEQKKERVGLEGRIRARQAASVDATGSAIGSVGLLAFAAITWKCLPSHSLWLVLPSASTAWLAVSILFWHIRKRDQILLGRRFRRS